MLNDVDLDILWNKARSQNGWNDKQVEESLIYKLYDLLKMAPTAANSCPARFVFITSPDAKNKLKKSLSEANIEKSMTAPVVVIIAYDVAFHNKLPQLFPHTDAKSWYEGNDAKIKEVAMMNATLQGAYLMLAARSVGLDCGPMGGFDNAVLDAEFFPNGENKSIFICGLGYGDSEKVFDRLPRLDFVDACKIL